jgi:ClpP class serine protease
LEAKDLGLIDMFGNQETAKELIKQKLNLTEVEFVTYEKPPTLLDLLTKMFNEQSFYVGRGIGAEITNLKLTNSLKITT